MSNNDDKKLQALKQWPTEQRPGEDEQEVESMISEIIEQVAKNFFKHSMQNKEVAKEFFHMCLPEYIQELVDFDSLEPIDTSLVIDSDKSDVLYRGRLSNGLNAPLYIICLERSEPDKFIDFYFKAYIKALLSYHRKTYPNEQIPFIYQSLFYTGEGEWGKYYTMEDLVDIDKYSVD